MIIRAASGTPLTADSIFSAMRRVRCFFPDHRLGLHLDPGAGGGGGKGADDDKGVEFWKADALAAREERDRVKEQARLMAEQQTTMQQQLADLAKKEQTRTAEEARRAEEASRSKLESEGKYKEALEAEQKKWAERHNALQQAAVKRLLDTGITAAAAQIANLTPDARADLPYLLRDAVRVNPETFELEVLDANGKPVSEVNKDGKLQPVPITTFLQQFVAKKPYLLLDNMQKGSGAKPGGQDGSATYTVKQALADEKIRDEWKAKDPDGYKAAFDQYNSPAEQTKRAQEMSKAENA